MENTLHYKISIMGKEYEKDGVKKRSWNTVGRLVQFKNSDVDAADGFIIELHTFPSEVFKVFQLDDLKSPKVGGMHNRDDDNQ